MITERISKIQMRLKQHLKIMVFGLLFGIISIIAPTVIAPVNEAYAVESSETTETASDSNASIEAARSEKKASCENTLGSISWLVCPTTGTISKAVDWLYDKVEEILIIDPIKIEDGQPIYEIWKYMRGITNIVFVIFFLIVIYSQVTGMGISNYGVKKILPKLIVVAILVNLSFIICSLAVDLSNIAGNSLKGVFDSITQSTMATTNATNATHFSLTEIYTAIGGGGLLAVGAGAIAVETGAIWMLIPMVFGALVSVVAGLITIALRQAVITLLVMVSPLAVVAYMLPNTEGWFRKWKDLFIKMLVFYPMFSLLFGASSLAGWAIISSADSLFGVILGVAVQIFPLFFSVSLMKMSGTFLSNVNSRISRMLSRPVGATAGWADSHRQLQRQRFLSTRNVYTPSLKLMQFMSDRKIAREAETAEHATTVKNRGLAYGAKRNYDKDGVPTKRGIRAYDEQAQNIRYGREQLRHKNNMNKGFGYLAKEGTRQRAILDKLDSETVQEADASYAESVRGEKIEYDNAVGRYNRMEDAMNAKLDSDNAYTIDAETGKKIPRKDYHRHFEDKKSEKAAFDRYNTISGIMEGNAVDVQYVMASAAQGYDTQRKVLETKMQKFYEMTPSSKDLKLRLDMIAQSKDAAKNIDAIVSGLRILNQRGDTDLIQNVLDDVLRNGLTLGTHASQAVASFTMFEVKDTDPMIRRYGKYINLETANVFASNKRKKMQIDFDEYIKGYHTEPDGTIMYAKKPMVTLLEGTPFDNIERTALSNMDDRIKLAYTDKDGKLDVDAWLKKREEVQNAIGPQFISASTKYLSGSEQLKAAVKFLTGYGYSQAKNDDGSIKTDEDGNVVYVWEATWDTDKDFVNDKDKVRKYFRRKTEQYFKDQTPSQILGLRSDYRDPAMEHLADAYLDSTPESEEEASKKADYEKRLSEIQTRYGDKSPEEAKKLREADIKKLKMEMAGEEVRKILRQSGKLAQIYRTRRSGAANNAKDWMRGWLNLDDEILINKELERNNRQKKAEYDAAHADDPEADEGTRVGGFTDSDRAFFAAEVEKMWEEWNDIEDEAKFYDASVEFVKHTLKDVGEVILKKYAEYAKNNPNADARDLMEYLKSLLLDPDNY